MLGYQLAVTGLNHVSAELSRQARKKSPRKQRRPRGAADGRAFPGAIGRCGVLPCFAVPLATGWLPCSSAGIHASFVARRPAETPSLKACAPEAGLPASRCWSFGLPHQVRPNVGGKIGQQSVRVKADFDRGRRAARRVANSGQIKRWKAASDAGAEELFRLLIRPAV